MAFERDVHDAKIGDLLRRSSASLQAAVNKAYANNFKLERPYKCTHRICFGMFGARKGTLHLTFGTHPKLGTWLSVWQPPALKGHS